MAERPDELDAKAGDHISVVAQSNFEWFVAKPINRLGRPGLIPVSFVAIHDPATGRAMAEPEVREIMQRGDVPGVEEWKRSILDYKAASISLGVIDDESFRGPVPNSPFMPQSQQPNDFDVAPSFQEPDRSRTPFPSLQPGMLMAAEVVSWHFEMNEYWFRINALYQPDDPSGSNKLPPAKQLVLFRTYSDFYEFQVNLLTTFPVEAGKTAKAGEKANRILPFMPGPAQEVDDKVTNIRREELDVYLQQLCGLWEYGAEAILRHQLVRDFFTPKAGDAEEEVEPTTRTFEERYGRVDESQEMVNQILRPLDKLSVRDRNEGRYSDGSIYEEERGLQSKVGNLSQRKPNGSEVVTNGTNGQNSYRDYERARSPPYGQTPTRYVNGARTQSPGPQGPQRSQSSLSGRKYSGDGGFAAKALQGQGSLSTVDSENGPYSGFRRHEDDSPSSFSSTSFGLSRSQSNANSPPISATNSNLAFVKIKIFDRLTQDLIAIRVSPRVTHTQLIDKIQSRFGKDIRHLAFRNSITNNFFSLDDDESLREWLEATDKLVLYAD